jgi:hypothetical protein
MDNSIMHLWKIKKKKLIKGYPTVTNDDLNYSEGKEKEMVEILGLKLGKSNLEVLSLIISL